MITFLSAWKTYKFLSSIHTTLETYRKLPPRHKHTTAYTQYWLFVCTTKQNFLFVPWTEALFYVSACFEWCNICTIYAHSTLVMAELLKCYCYCSSPSGAALRSLDQVREYLQAAGTCKCGLDCPVRPECTFNFDPKVRNVHCVPTTINVQMNCIESVFKCYLEYILFGN